MMQLLSPSESSRDIERSAAEHDAEAPAAAPLAENSGARYGG
jgi:hypothetical protein